MLLDTPRRWHPCAVLRALLPLVLLTGACATHAGRTATRGPAGAGSASRREIDPATLQTGRVARRDRHINAGELQEWAPRLPLDEAVVMLRPHFFLRERAEPLVYVDGAHRGGLATLRMIPPRWVKRVELFDRAEAAQRYGRANNAVVEVTLRPRSERDLPP